MFQDHRVSVVIPAYNEEETIGGVVDDMRQCELVDEIVVVDNNSRDRTGEIARARGARVVEETTPGYGSALRCGLDAADGEILVMVEADGSFRSEDILKLLVYLEDAGMVLGTRTTRQMVQQGANMDFSLRWGNVTMAKILELLWYVPHEPRLTDVGCTYRALWKTTWQAIASHLSEPGPAFSPEMMCEALTQGFRVIEVPVHYYRRMGGDSKHSDSFLKVAKTALMMFRTIVRKRWESLGAPRSGSAAEAEKA
ncbi:MAG: glycosyltransferase family 2 protein [Planctomycetota bacterium]